MRPIRRRLLGDPGVEAERSVAGRFIHNFDADENVAFARAFELPVTWFFLPPGPWSDKPGVPVKLATPDAEEFGAALGLLVDLVFGEPPTVTAGHAPAGVLGRPRASGPDDHKAVGGQGLSPDPEWAHDPGGANTSSRRSPARRCCSTVWVRC